MMWMSNRLTVFVWKCRVEVEWWVDLIQRDWGVDGLCCGSLGFFPVLFNVFGSRGQLETTCSSKHEREKKLSSCYQSSALWRVRSEASGILQLKVWSLCWASLWGRFLSWKALSFCLELWRGGAFCRKDVSLLKSFCTKKTSHIVSRVTAFARWTLFFCVWFLKGVFAHPVRFEQGLSYLRVSCYPTPNWETLLNVKCFLLMCWAAVWISGTVNHTVYPRGACVL